MQIQPTMFSPSFIRWVGPPIATHQLESLDELEQHIFTCCQERFTGRLDLSIQFKQATQWNLFFHLGYLIWVTSEVHPMRCWYRQLSRYHAALSSESGDRANALVYRNYDGFAELVKQRKLSKASMVAMVESYSAEILFDILQLWKSSRDRCNAQLTYRRIPADAVKAVPVLMPAESVWHQAVKAWNTWKAAGLEQWSPNLAPIIWDTEDLRQQTSLLAYHNLTMLVDGHHTLRDLAVKLKQNPLPLTQSIVPYVRRKAIGLVEVPDSNSPLPSAIASISEAGAVVAQTKPAQSSPLVAYIDDSRFDNQAMQRILAQANCRFISIRDPVQALPILLEQKPDLLFLDLLMPVTNGYEVCAQIRRISMFKNLPVVIVTASDGIVDRVRAKLVGASGFISKPIDMEKVLPVLQQHLPISRSVYPRETKAAAPGFFHSPA